MLSPKMHVEGRVGVFGNTSHSIAWLQSHQHKVLGHLKHINLMGLAFKVEAGHTIGRIHLKELG